MVRRIPGQTPESPVPPGVYVLRELALGLLGGCLQVVEGRKWDLGSSGLWLQPPMGGTHVREQLGSCICECIRVPHGPGDTSGVHILN